MTQLVSVRSFPLINGKRVLPEGVVYIGRAVPRVGLTESEWANPWRIGQPHPNPAYRGQVHLVRFEVLELFSDYLLRCLAKDPWWLEPLRGRVLACWCYSPDDCHGGIIVRWLETNPPQPREGERIEFGVHAMPPAAAETAPAWPSLASVRAAADAKFRREQRKVRV